MNMKMLKTLRSMMRPPLWVLVLLGMWGPALTWSQTILSDADWPYRNKQLRPMVTRSDGFDTLPFSAAQPFFDDFSTVSTEPNANLWYADSGVFDLPLKTFQMAVDPPSYGVVTFDGQKRDGRPYATNAIISGVADRLLSQRIDLSNFGPADSVILSFYLQPQGRGEAPEAIDSFYVYVRTNLPEEEWRLLFATRGRPTTSFDQVILPLEDPEYFHPGFQLRFESIGGLSGALDHWHLDYVALAPNQQRNNISYDDRSITQVLESPLAPYTAIPAPHYDPGQRYMNDFELNLSNLDDQPQSAQVVATIDDPVGSHDYGSGSLSGGSANVPPFAQGTEAITIGAFEDQFLDFGIATYRLTASLNGNPDAFPGNDTLRKRFGIDSLLAYDDGEADAQFGLNKPWSYGIKVQLDQPDSVTAVWISFVPSVYFNQVSGIITYLENEPFRILFWDSPDPDSIITQQAGGVRVRYGDGPNHFERYEFPSPVAVPSTFWVGIQQVNSIPLGVGLDRTFDRDPFTYFDSNGDWINTNLDGALMIRPEFKRTALVPVGLPGEVITQATPTLYPQPLRVGQPIRLRWPTGVDRSVRYQAQLLNLQGQVIWQSEPAPAAAQSALSLPAQLTPGYYLWKHRILGAKGKASVQYDRLLLHP